MNEKILKDVIEDFQIDKFTRFFRAKNDKFRFPHQPLFCEEDNFKEATKVAEVNLEDGNLIVCSFLVQQPLSERSGKKAQYELGKKILKENQADAGIFIFYDVKGSFRFSLIYANYLGTHRDWSNFKRFTYLVSSELTNKTFLEQIGEGDFSTLETIKKAFSVEPVTKQFYNEIQSWYFWAMDQIQFPDDYQFSADPVKDREIRNATSLIRLITRIIFIWFLKEKGLVSLALFTKEKIQKIVKDFRESETASNFYNAILQNLFFATLNQKMDERKFIENEGYPANKKEYGVKTLYRYEDKFLIGKDEVLKLFKDIPFLDGGLFDCLDKEDETGKVVYIDGFSRNPAKRSILPDYLFFQEKEKRVDLSEYGLGPDKAVRGLIEILNSYNFTIDENTPVDQEVALDPELLGRVFENLLASYNPETATTARKATGSYYTPREIVDYMVEESLCEYLKDKLPELTEEKIRMLISYSEGNPAFSGEEIQKLISVIDDIKILDPACGSGAFPMGILHKLVFTLQKLDPENKYWYELQYQKALKESKEVFKEGDKNEREERLKEINEAFDEGINYPDYARKLYLIENCIYGVDIQPIAIQISKLRFFISLVLDEKVDRNKDNFGIKALPNLETKFVAANTLIGLEKPEHLFCTEEIKNLEDQIKALRHKYFQAKTRSEKLRYQQKDKELRELLAKKLKSIGFSSESSEKIASFDLYDQNASADFFDPEWMFGVNGGFDIVIGNPPYIKEYTSKKAFDGLRNSSYYQGKMDIWYLFACKGIDLLKKNSGVLTYIAQNNWVTSYGASKMRNKVIKDTQIIQMIDFGSYKIFESSGIQTMIMIFKADSTSDNYAFDYRRLEGNELNFNDVLDLLKRNPNSKTIYLKPTIQKNKFLNKPLTFSTTEVDEILNKISEQSNFKLTENEIAQGIVPNPDIVSKSSINKIPESKVEKFNIRVGDGVFVIKKGNLNELTKNEKKLLKPLYTPNELSRYFMPKEHNYEIIYFTKNNSPGDYPNIVSHLKKYKEIMEERRENKEGKISYYHLHWPREKYFFEYGPKILGVRKCEIPTFVYTEKEAYVMMAINIIKTERINLKYLTTLLNSKLIAFWLKHKGKMQGDNYQIDKEPLLALPLKTIPSLDQQPFIDLVDKILAITKDEDYLENSAKQTKVKEYERQIDLLVYELYGLTEEEIKIIEGINYGK